jgi:hypothetical protein
LEKFNISPGLTAAHGHSDPLDRSLASRPKMVAIGLAHAIQSASSARLTRGHRAVLTGASAAKLHKVST